jgi:hypothetical protein
MTAVYNRRLLSMARKKNEQKNFSQVAAQSDAVKTNTSTREALTTTLNHFISAGNMVSIKKIRQHLCNPWAFFNSLEFV